METLENLELSVQAELMRWIENHPQWTINKAVFEFYKRGLEDGAENPALAMLVIDDEG